MRSKEWLTELAAMVPAAGVDILTMCEVTASEEQPWWGACAPDLELVRDFAYPAAMAWRFAAPRVEPALHLAWLEAQLHWPIEARRVTSLEAEPGDVVVNCTGLGSRSLTGDRELQGLFGQTVVVEPGTIDLTRVTVEERSEEWLFYAIPRRQTVVLGGCSTPVADDYGLEPDPAFTAEILARAAWAGLPPGAVVRSKCGLRPYRTTVRLERDGRIYHKYCHGGAGYTLARGCAEEVADLV
jgi:D-amino-acid oxidase